MAEAEKGPLIEHTVFFAAVSLIVHVATQSNQRSLLHYNSTYHYFMINPLHVQMYLVLMEWFGCLWLSVKWHV